MSETEKNIKKVDRAWSKLYGRLDADGLLLSAEGEKRHAHSYALRKWGAVAAVFIGVCIYWAMGYFKADAPVVAQTLIMQQNREQSTLVTTLEDGSIVYLGGETSLQYPEHFSAEKREVALQGNALFDVTGNRNRPFLIETDEVRIEVLGTAFHVKSDLGTPFQLSVQRGRVKVTLKKKNQDVYVNAGETVTLKTQQFHLTNNGDDGQFARYLENIRFKDEPLSNILRVINLHSSDLQIQASPALAERRLTVAFSENSAESMAELISLAMNLKCTREGNTFILSE